MSPQTKRVLSFIVNCLRGVGQVFFMNNPLSGLIILTGLFVQSPRVAFHGEKPLFLLLSKPCPRLALLTSFAPSLTSLSLTHNQEKSLAHTRDVALGLRFRLLLHPMLAFVP